MTTNHADPGSATQLSDILKYRNDEVLQEKNSVLAQIAQQAQRDSQAMKELALIATMYLPATLIGVSSYSCIRAQVYVLRWLIISWRVEQTIFCSNLIQIRPENASQGSQIVVAPQFWAYVLVALSLLVLTFCIARALKSNAIRRLKCRMWWRRASSGWLLSAV